MQNIPSDQTEMLKIKLATKFFIKHKSIMLKFCVAIVLIGCFFGGCSYLNKKLNLPNDNFIEEKIEEIIEHETGLTVDLTPDDLDYPNF